MQTWSGLHEAARQHLRRAVLLLSRRNAQLIARKGTALANGHYQPNDNALQPPNLSLTQSGISCTDTFKAWY